MRIIKIGGAWLAQMERARLCMFRARVGVRHIFVLTNAAHDFCPARFISDQNLWALWRHHVHIKNTTAMGCSPHGNFLGIMQMTDNGQNWPAATGSSTAGRAGSPLPALRVDWQGAARTE
jgi:hypothetical protein